MAITEVQARTANITLPSIHLGSFASQYPSSMPPSDLQTQNRRSSRFADLTGPLGLDDTATPYPTPQRSRQGQDWRSTNGGPYPNITSNSYRSYSPASPRQSYNPNTPSRGPPANALYPAGVSPLPLQPPNSPAQMAGTPKELCLECMMRDEDMADVDVTSPGVWERESDAYYVELCRREEEEEREREMHPTSSSGVSSSMGEHRLPRARGAKMTEGNLAVWNTLNPPEPASKHQTLLSYLDTQNTLLRAESRARQQAMKESRLLDEKMRNAYAELRQSSYEVASPSNINHPPDEPGSGPGLKIRSPSLRGFVDDPRSSLKREATLLENGLIVERVDVRKEEARIRRDERRARKASRDSLALFDSRGDAMSLYSLQAVEAASLRAPAPYESTTSVPMPTNRSVRSMYTMPSTPWGTPTPVARPFSMAGAGASATSLNTTASPRRRFFGGMRKLSGYFGSEASLAQSGSMMDMHLGLDQEKQLARSPGPERESMRSPPINESEPWPQLDSERTSPRSLDDGPAVDTPKKKKKRGLSRLWKIFTAPGKNQASVYTSNSPRNPEDDLPLAPPPPLSYLVDRGSMQSERPALSSTGRHVSMPSLSLPSQKGHHPRSNSIRSAIGISLSSPSDGSSTLPSPTEARFPGAPREQHVHGLELNADDAGAYEDEMEGIGKRRVNGLDVRILFA
ncbi:hypothetical protein M422DRAFT_68708 [Sphaerobolus stellatus SS14]|uniref:Uncharacterized protein n=1 Tax=Sphaerobolus stellatus (strain SS14) TaxID=990650 RepID=A0A0C9UA00_SPHS4|nr:hypothetical protein M422DRAFT_68708 [Sphaerobolus stellatus SS14]